MLSPKGMVLKSFIAMLAVSLASLFGCSKTAVPASTAKSSSATPALVKDLGVLELTNHYETNVKFGPNRNCRIVPKMLDRHDIELTLTVESKSPDGRISGLSIVQVTGKTEQPFQVSIGNTDFSFTPEIADARSF
jgi:hypothetical protein